MKILEITLCSLAMMGTILTPNAKADEWNRKTRITFSGPVEIPGVHLKGWNVLPAGSYVFRILDSQSDRHIVQILNPEETTVYATILAIPNYRLQATDKTTITFRERPAGQPEALRAWFYPGRNWGEEFVYPKATAIALAKATSTAVLFTPAELPAEVEVPITSPDSPVIAQLKRAEVMAIKPTGEEVQLAQVVTPPPAEAAQARAPEPAEAAQARPPEPAVQRPVEDRQAVTDSAGPAAAQVKTESPEAAAATLPATGSTLPLTASLGLLALGAAVAARAIAKHLR